jgi:hypothetical protein
VAFTIDLHEHLVEMPTPSAGLHPCNPALSDFSGEHRPEPVPPEPHHFVAHINATLVQKVFHVPQRQWEPDVQHDHQADGFRASLEIAKWRSFGHGWTLQNRPVRLKPVSSDSADPSAWTNEIALRPRVEWF